MTNTLRSPTVAGHPWTSIDHPINANPPPERTMAVSRPVGRTGPTFGNFNAAKKRQPLNCRWLASLSIHYQSWEDTFSGRTFFRNAAPTFSHKFHFETTSFYRYGKKSQPLIQRKLASTPVMTRGKKGLQGEPRMGVYVIWLWFHH